MTPMVKAICWVASVATPVPSLADAVSSSL
jgi:hypothetical protein